MDSDIPKDLQRTEEVQNIIERMPTNFGVLVTGIVVFIFSLLMIFGWQIRYPDMVKGQVTVNSNISPIKLVANNSGKIKLNGIKSMQNVKEGQIIAYIDNPTNPSGVHFIDSLLQSFNPNVVDIRNAKTKFPRNYSIGELNTKYYAFVNSLQDFINNEENTPLSKQSESFVQILNEQRKAKTSALKRLETGENSLQYAHKFFTRDSTLFLKKIISDAEFDKSEMTYNTSKDNYQNLLNNFISVKQQIQETQSKIQDFSIQGSEKDKQLSIALVSAYNDLKDNIKTWEQKYVFKAPFSGKIQFLKFWTNNQFVQSGEQIFTIIPEKNEIIGQVILPVNGAGKVKIGQEVIVKLDDYPYVEYGSIKGKVKSISLTTNTTRTDKGDVENYLVIIDFPNQLKTNYGTVLNFKFESKGTAEIIAKDRKLIERLFDNLKYITK